MAKKIVPFTYDDYASLPQDRFIHQIIDGEHFMNPSPIPYHQDISRNLQRILVEFVERNDLGKIYDAPIDVVLSDTNVVVPDLIFISRARTSIILEKYIAGPPDLVVEILSPGTRKLDLDLKLKLYARFRVPEYWIIDPKQKTVRLYRLGKAAQEEKLFHEDEVLTSPSLPGLRIPLAEVFRS
ncbi:MAG TPA: Uma2 family endonuclease [Acidobacteriota bacterium]|jgi:Uma2 family endonuclease